MPKPSLARSIGHVLAFASHTTDRVIGWGFRSMSQAAKERKHTPPAKGFAGRSVHLGRSLIRFLGTAGEAYYDKYEELKKSKK